MSRFDARSSSGTTARRYLRRGSLAVAAGAGAAALLAGCSSGQLAETSEIKSAVQGASASSANGAIELRNLLVQAPTGDATGYPSGSTAPLVVFIANSGSGTDTLTSVSSTAGRVVLVGSTASPSETPSASPSRRGHRPASPSGSASASASGSASPSDSTSPSASPSVAGTARYRLTVPADASALLRPTDQGGGEYLALTGLRESLSPGGSVRLVFHFEHAGPIRVKVPLNGPTVVATRSTAAGDKSE